MGIGLGGRLILDASPISCTPSTVILVHFSFCWVAASAEKWVVHAELPGIRRISLLYCYPSYFFG